MCKFTKQKLIFLFCSEQIRSIWSIACWVNTGFAIKRLNTETRIISKNRRVYSVVELLCFDICIFKKLRPCSSGWKSKIPASEGNTRVWLAKKGRSSWILWGLLLARKIFMLHVSNLVFDNLQGYALSRWIFLNSRGLNRHCLLVLQGFRQCIRSKRLIF